MNWAPFSAKEHLEHFADFCAKVRAAGGATPHMLMVVEAARRAADEREALWRGCCYAATYNFASRRALR